MELGRRAKWLDFARHRVLWLAAAGEEAIVFDAPVLSRKTYPSKYWMCNASSLIYSSINGAILHGNIIMRYFNIIILWRILAVLISIAVLSSSPSQASCTSPAGEGGDIVYNAGHRLMQYCNGDNWIGFPKGSSGCALPWGGTIDSGGSSGNA